MPAQKHTITLMPSNLPYPGFVAQFSDPDVKRVMGTDTLPTPFTLSADPLLVLHTIAAENPGSIIRLLNAKGQMTHRKIT